MIFIIRVSSTSDSSLVSVCTVNIKKNLLALSINATSVKICQKTTTKSIIAVLNASFSANVKNLRSVQFLSIKFSIVLKHLWITLSSTLVVLNLDSNRFSREALSGVPTNRTKSNRPGRVTAASKLRKRFVATMNMTDCCLLRSFN